MWQIPEAICVVPTLPQRVRQRHDVAPIEDVAACPNPGSAVIVAQHTMQELMSEAKRCLVVDFTWSLFVGQVNFTRQCAGLTILLQDREPVAVTLANLTPVEPETVSVL